MLLPLTWYARLYNITVLLIMVHAVKLTFVEQQIFPKSCYISLNIYKCYYLHTLFERIVSLLK